MPDIQVYQLLAGFYIFANISDQIREELENNTPLAVVLKTAIPLVMENDSMTAQEFEWYSVSIDFATVAKEQGETITNTPFGLAWPRQASGEPVYQDKNAQNIIDILNK